MVVKCNKLLYINSTQLSSGTVSIDGVTVKLPESVKEIGWYTVNEYAANKKTSYITSMRKAYSVNGDIEEARQIIKMFGATIIPFEVRVLWNNYTDPTLTVFLASHPLYNNGLCYVSLTNSGAIVVTSADDEFIDHICRSSYNTISRLSCKLLAEEVKQCLMNGTHMLPLDDKFIPLSGHKLIQPINPCEPIIKHKYFQISRQRNEVVNSDTYTLQYSPIAASGAIVNICEIYSELGNSDTAPWLIELYHQCQ